MSLNFSYSEHLGQPRISAFTAVRGSRSGAMTTAPSFTLRCRASLLAHQHHQMCQFVLA